MAATKMTKNQMRRAKRKEQKKAQAEVTSSFLHSMRLRTDCSWKPTSHAETDTEEHEQPLKNGDANAEQAVEGDKAQTQQVQPATEDVPNDDYYDSAVDQALLSNDPVYADYKGLLARFGGQLDEGATDENSGNKGEVFYDDDDEIPDEEEESGSTKMSKKKLKKLNKLSIAELKSLVANPEVVEWHDVSSSDPRLLVQIKAQRNIVPVPTHWALKRDYLSSKRGIEKPAFRLPKFIAETGITEMRDAVLEKQAEQTLKQKQRERVQPKMGKLDIDYQKLYDAFFRFQTKPDLTRFGDVYYEGKEWEADYRSFKPGELSDALKEALGMQPGFPPPWLLQQQRMGLPPSYPTLKIPGLNSPLPPGAVWGYQPGQWGKPPLDEFNRPLYGGDVFGIMPGQPGQPGAAPQTAPVLQSAQQTLIREQVDHSLWGELQPPAEESEEEEEDSNDEEGSEGDEADVPGGLQTPGGLETPGGYVSSVPTDLPGRGVETSMAGEFDLRKQRRGFNTEESSAGAHSRSAYQVIPERQARVEGFFGSDRTYDLSKQGGANVPVLGQEDDSGRKRKKPGDVDVALDPESLVQQNGIAKDELRRRYEEGRKEEGPGSKWHYDDDLSEMIAQESRKKQRPNDDKKGDRKREQKYRF
jgi:splicing factor 3B subunit 2